MQSDMNEDGEGDNHGRLYFSEKIGKMKKKYKVDFQGFKKRIEGRKDKEVFEEWDDFIQWDSYEEALRYWTEVEERVKGKVK